MTPWLVSTEWNLSWNKRSAVVSRTATCRPPWPTMSLRVNVMWNLSWIMCCAVVS